MISRSHLHVLMLALLSHKVKVNCGQPSWCEDTHGNIEWIYDGPVCTEWPTRNRQWYGVFIVHQKNFQRLFSRICAKVLKIKSKPFLWNDHKSENLKIYRIKCLYLLLIITLITIILISLNFCFVLNCNFGCYPRLRGRNGAHHVST